MTLRATAVRHRVLMGSIAVVVVVSFTVTPMLGSISSIPLTKGLWFVSGPYGLSGNTTYSILVHGVNFTFMYYIPPFATDVPHVVHFEVTFPDSLVEEMVFGAGGMALAAHVTLSDHTGPTAAIFKPYSHSHESHYSWFLAVEIW